MGSVLLPSRDDDHWHNKFLTQKRLRLSDGQFSPKTLMADSMTTKE